MHTSQQQSPVLAQDHFRLIFTHSQDAILLLDVERDLIAEANPRAAELLGYERDELVGTSVSTIHPDEMVRLRRFAAAVAQKGSGWTDALSCTTKSSGKLPAEISASAVEVDGRRLVLAMVRDVTVRQRIEESRARLVRGFTHDGSLTAPRKICRWWRPTAAGCARSSATCYPTPSSTPRRGGR